MSESLQTREIAAGVSIAPQLTPEMMREVAAAGFRSVINNRPDFEAGATQPTDAALAAAAQAAGLVYAYQPVSSRQVTTDDVSRFGELLAELPQPLLAFCRSGARCNILFQAATRD